MKSTIRDLSTVVLRLRNSNPDGWEMFLKVFADQTEQAVDAVTEAPPEAILIAQGRAQAHRKLLRCFEECDKQTTTSPATQP